MKILREGKIKPPSIFVFACDKCDCVFECERDEIEMRSSLHQLDGPIYLCVCPTPNCGNKVSGDLKKGEGKWGHLEKR